MFTCIVRRIMRFGLWLAVLCLVGCATTQPTDPARLAFKLAPATLGESIALQQHLKVERSGRIDELDAALEVDANHIELIGLALGQRVLSLNYDGHELKSWRHVLLPSQVQAEDVLQDLQLVMWPIEPIRNALPEGWRVEDVGLRRTLYQGAQPMTVIDYNGMPRWNGTATLENLRFHYRLTIQSVPSNT
jgi:hypothetical protein